MRQWTSETVRQSTSEAVRQWDSGTVGQWNTRAKLGMGYTCFSHYLCCFHKLAQSVAIRISDFILELHSASQLVHAEDYFSWSPVNIQGSKDTACSIKMKRLMIELKL